MEIEYVQDIMKMSSTEAPYAYWTCRHRHEGKELAGGTRGITQVGSFKEHVIDQIKELLGDQVFQWNAKKEVMTSIKASAVWTDWTTAGEKHQMRQLIHCIIKEHK
jgi:hypothetical protein